MGNVALTVPGVKHICDEIVYEGDLRFGHAAGVSVEHGHHHGQPLSLLLVRLRAKTKTNSVASKQNNESFDGEQTGCLPRPPAPTWAKYSSEIRPAHSMQSSRGLQGFATSAHLISIRFISRRFSGEFLMLLWPSQSLFVLCRKYHTGTSDVINRNIGDSDQLVVDANIGYG